MFNEKKKKTSKTLEQTTQHRNVVPVQEESMNQGEYDNDYLLFNRKIQFIHHKRKLVKAML